MAKRELDAVALENDVVTAWQLLIPQAFDKVGDGVSGRFLLHGLRGSHDFLVSRNVAETTDLFRQHGLFSAAVVVVVLVVDD